MKYDAKGPKRYVDMIRNSGSSIYDPIKAGDHDLWIPTPDLEELLNSAMKGISLAGLPLRTRSKVVKEHICRALGYPVPSSFKRPSHDFKDSSSTHMYKNQTTFRFGMKSWNHHGDMS